MPDLRSFAVAIVAGLAVTAFLVLWWQWSILAGIVVGAILWGLVLTTSVSLGPDATKAEAAWRAAAPDLIEEPPRSPTEP